MILTSDQLNAHVDGHASKRPKWNVQLILCVLAFPPRRMSAPRPARLARSRVAVAEDASVIVP